MEKVNKQTKNIKEREFEYIIYEYNEHKNDIEYITSKKDIIDSINCVNGYLLSNGDNVNIIKDIEKIVKNRNINKYITTDINNLKIINQYIIFKQYKDNLQNGKYILNKLEKQALTNDKININKLYKKEITTYKYHKKGYKINKEKTIKLSKKDFFKKKLEMELKLQQAFDRKHDNKNIVKGGIYETI